MNDNTLQLRKAVWPHIEAIMRAKDGKTVSDAAIDIIALVRADGRTRMATELWERALDPATVEAVAMDVFRNDPSNADEWHMLSPYMAEVHIAYAMAHTTALLTTLIGPPKKVTA